MSRRSEKIAMVAPTRPHGASIRRMLSALCLTGLMPAAVQGEGAVRLLECTVVKECDAAGLCETASTQVMFRMEPVEIGTDGSGRYSLRYGDVEAAMDARSAAGPFFWTVGNQWDTLLASSETEFLWHRLTFAPAPSASIQFLSCAFRQ